MTTGTWIIAIMFASAVSCLVGAIMDRHVFVNWITGYPSEDGVSGPHCINDKFYYVVRESTWIDRDRRHVSGKMRKADHIELPMDGMEEEDYF